MPYIRDSFFAGREFASLARMQAEALRWATQVYGVHKHRGLDGQTPGSVFAAIEADALLPLPARPFESVIYTIGRVAPDCHVKSGKPFYSVPWRLMGQQVTVRTAGDVVQIFHNGTVVATHVLHLSGRSTNFEHYPPHKIAHTLRSVTWCRTQAEQIGPGVVAIVAELSPGQCDPPAAGHPRDHPAARHLRRHSPGCGLRESTPGRGSELPHRQRHPGRRHRIRRRPTGARPDAAGDTARP